MKKPYIYNAVVYILTKQKWLFVLSFIAMSVFGASRNHTLTTIATYYFFAFIAITILGGISYFIHMRRNRPKLSDNYLMNHSFPGVKEDLQKSKTNRGWYILMFAILLISVIIAIHDSTHKYHGGAWIFATLIVLLMVIVHFKNNSE